MTDINKGYYDPTIKKIIDDLVSQQPQPGFVQLRNELANQLMLNPNLLGGKQPWRLIADAQTIEELYALGNYFQESGVLQESPIWQLYHEKRIVLAKQPSLFGAGTGERVYGLPVKPEEFIRNAVFGPRGIGVHRNLAGQLFTEEQLLGRTPISIDRQGMNYNKFVSERMAKGRPPRWMSFDYETTGLLHQFAYKNTGSGRGILSLGYQTAAGQKGHFAKKFTGGFYPGDYISDVIIPRTESALVGGKAKLIQNERTLLRNWMRALGTEDKIARRAARAAGSKTFERAALIGYNIKGFDIPVSEFMAYRYGVSKQYAALMKNRQVIDVAEYARAFLSEKFASRYVGFTAQAIEKMNMNPVGWRQEVMAYALGITKRENLGISAHTAEVDATTSHKLLKVLTRRDGALASRIWEKGGEKRYFEALEYFKQKLVPMSELEAMTKQVGGKTFLDLERAGMKLPDFIKTQERLAGKFNLVESARKISLKIPTIPPTITSGAWKVSKFAAGGALLGAVLPGRGTSNLVGGYAALGAYKALRGPLPIRLGAAAVAYGITKGAALAFSGKDDNYNTIEGFPERGISAVTRKENTAFGSGWQGIDIRERSPVEQLVSERPAPTGPQVVHGQPIDPRIMEFRERWFSSPEAEQELEEKKSGSGSTPGEFLPSELTPIGGGRAAVDLSAYTPTWEDVDTLLLKSPWYKFWKPDIAVRLVGIDAPEIASHEEDVMDWARYKQEQPYGQEGTDIVRNRFEGSTLRLEIAADPKQRTYGRYLGLVYQGKDLEPLNVKFAREGLAAALPFGESGSDIYPRKIFMDVEKEARARNVGMWQSDYWRRYLDITGAAGARITNTSFTDLTRLSKNLNLAAAEELMSREDIEYEPWMGKYIGKKLRSMTESYRPKTRKRPKPQDERPVPNYNYTDRYNAMDGLSHRGIAQDNRHALTDFGGAWQGLARAAENGLTRIRSAFSETIGSLVSKTKLDIKVPIDYYAGIRKSPREVHVIGDRLLLEFHTLKQAREVAVESSFGGIPHRVPVRWRGKHDPLGIALSQKDLEQKIEALSQDIKFQKIRGKGTGKHYIPKDPNAISGFPEDGLAARGRKVNTDFSSPWRGLWEGVSLGISRAVSSTKTAFSKIAGKTIREELSIGQKRLTTEIAKSVERVKLDPVHIATRSTIPASAYEASLPTLVHHNKQLTGLKEYVNYVREKNLSSPMTTIIGREQKGLHAIVPPAISRSNYRIPKSNHAPNPISGMSNEGLAAENRPKITDFKKEHGSRWGGLRNAHGGIRGRWLLGGGVLALGVISLAGKLFGHNESNKENKSSLLKTTLTGIGVTAAIALGISAIPAAQIAYTLKRSQLVAGKDIITNAFIRKSAWGAFKSSINANLAALKTYKDIHFDEKVISAMKASGKELHSTGAYSTAWGRALFPFQKAEEFIEHTAAWLGKNWMPEFKKFEPGAVALGALSAYDAYHMSKSAYEGDIGGVAKGALTFAAGKYAYMGYYKYLRTPELRKVALGWAKKQTKWDWAGYGMLGLDSVSTAKTAGMEATSYYAAFVRTGAPYPEYLSHLAAKGYTNYKKAFSGITDEYLGFVDDLPPDIKERIMKELPDVKKVIDNVKGLKQEAKKAQDSFLNLTEDEFIKLQKENQAMIGKEVDKTSKYSWAMSHIMSQYANAPEEVLRTKAWPKIEKLQKTLSGYQNSGSATDKLRKASEGVPSEPFKQAHNAGKRHSRSVSGTLR